LRCCKAVWQAKFSFPKNWLVKYTAISKERQALVIGEIPKPASGYSAHFPFADG
jgi:hypothetical protein